MTIQYASDLHLEFPENEFHIKNNPLKPGADILLLAGDIGLLKELPRYDWFFDYVSENFGTTYWIAGNHEYYHYDLANKRGTFYEAIRDYVFLINDYAVTTNNARLIFATLWTSIKPNHQIAIERRMNDFHLICKSGHRLTSEDLQQEHDVSLAFIKKELSEDTPGLKKIVVTHHVPTFVNYPPEYFGDVLN
jgi:predicted phosphohydrolase